jgi:hypothetical protein
MGLHSTMRALVSTANRSIVQPNNPSSDQSLASSLAWALVIGGGFAGGVLSVFIGDLVSSGAIHDLVAGWQTAGSEMGGAFNGVSHGEMELMKRGAAIALRAVA